MAELISGTKIAKELVETLKEKTFSLRETGQRLPCLAVILVGKDPASEVYVSHKRKKCEKIGFTSKFFPLSEEASEKELHNLIEELNHAKDVDGILLQLPLPKNFNTDKALDLISPEKDVDGLTSSNQGLLLQKRASFIPCTPKGIITMLEKTGIELEGKRACVIGRSKLVGLPIALLLSEKNATVTMIHSRTKNPKELTKQCDIVVVAAGVPHLVDDAWLKEGAVVIDVGIHRGKDGKLMGDVHSEKAQKKCSFLTPVPGGVGPMTVASLMENTYLAYEKRLTKES